MPAGIGQSKNAVRDSPAADRPGRPLDRIAGFHLRAGDERGPSVSGCAGVFRSLLPRRPGRFYNQPSNTISVSGRTTLICIRPPGVFSRRTASMIRRADRARRRSYSFFETKAEKVAADQSGRLHCTLLTTCRRSSTPGAWRRCGEDPFRPPTASMPGMPSRPAASRIVA